MYHETKKYIKDLIFFAFLAAIAICKLDCEPYFCFLFGSYLHLGPKSFCIKTLQQTFTSCSKLEKSIKVATVVFLICNCMAAIWQSFQCYANLFTKNRNCVIEAERYHNAITDIYYEGAIPSPREYLKLFSKTFFATMRKLLHFPSAV